LRPGAWLINAARGAVVDNAALRELLAQRPDTQAVLDVWEGEPQVDVELAELCWIATPHIAGYSLDGKLRGTAQIYQAFCASRGLEPKVALSELMPVTPLRGLLFDASAEPGDVLATICRAIYDPRRDDAAFRRSLCEGEEQRRIGFDQLRKQYPQRREIDSLQIQISSSQPQLEQLVGALGATLKR
jgi:erythronate-4-phosphate dehydrogenase